jgi:hypothetical protein
MERSPGRARSSPLLQFAITATCEVERITKALTKQPRPDPFHTTLAALLSNVSSRLKELEQVGTKADEKGIFELLAALERLVRVSSASSRVTPCFN